jgi:flavin-dependent thymidylate synthase
MRPRKLSLTVDDETRYGTNFTVEFLSGAVAQVDFVDGPRQPKLTLAKTTRGYKGIYSNDPPSAQEIDDLLADIKKTRLGTPIEMAYFVFLLRDVPRAFTHQLVRTRLASYVQESTRFLGKKNLYQVLAPKTSISKNGVVDEDYVAGTVASIRSYVTIMDAGVMSNEDARLVLPHSLLTNVFWGISLSSLMTVYNVRWCCQAESSTWLPVMAGIRNALYDNYGDDISGFLTAPIDRGQDCGFHASFDRPCEWKKRE